MTSESTGSTVQHLADGRWAALTLATIIGLAGGCTGTIGATSSTAEPGSGGSTSTTATTGAGGTTSGTGNGGTPVSCGAIDPGRVTIHRLNNLEFNNTVRDLLGDTTQPASMFPPDTGGANFDNNADVLAMSPVLLEDLESASDTLANAAVAPGSAALSKIITCDPSKVGDSACATTVMTAFARRAWRRKPTSDEISRLTAFVPLAKNNGDGFNQGIALGIKAALLSPNFLFRPELDPDPNAKAPRALNSYEVASRLSYFLWSSMPDDTLAAAADANGLQDVASVQQQATRMLADPKASQLVTTMGGEWFGTYKMANVSPLPTSFPSYDAALAAAMTQETTLFLNDFFMGTGSFLDALDAPWTYANARLAQHYGLSGVTGTGFQKVSLDGIEASGRADAGRNVDDDLAPHANVTRQAGAVDARQHPLFAATVAARQRSRPWSRPRCRLVRPSASSWRPTVADPACASLPQAHGPDRLRARALRRNRALAGHGRSGFHRCDRGAPQRPELRRRDAAGGRFEAAGVPDLRLCVAEDVRLFAGPRSRSRRARHVPGQPTVVAIYQGELQHPEPDHADGRQ